MTATVGGNLILPSLQYTTTYAEKKQQVFVSGILILIQTSPASGSAKLAKRNTNSTCASLKEQSGIKAGDAGFSVHVQGNTDLKGGAITSTQAEIDNRKNTFTSGCFVVRHHGC